ncbi:MAG: hypothetical protein RIM33_17635 [Alphaproteobacteria bacterium]
MLKQLEMIVDKVANAPKPPLPVGLVEEVPSDDSADMKAVRQGTAYLPAGVAIEYIDADGNFSARRVTVQAIDMCEDDPALIGHCHVRQEMRTFRLSGIKCLFDPVGAPQTFSDPHDFLNRFRIDDPADGEADPARALLHEARDEMIVLMFFARCDGYLHPSERTVMIDYLKSRFAKSDSALEEGWEVMRRLYPDSRTMLASARTIVSAQGKPALRDLQATIRTLIEADGLLHTNELMHAIEIAYVD